MSDAYTLAATQTNGDVMTYTTAPEDGVIDVVVDCADADRIQLRRDTSSGYGAAGYGQ